VLLLGRKHGVDALRWVKWSMLIYGPGGKRQQQSSETEALAWSPSHLNRLTLEDTAMCTLLPQGCAPGMIAGADIENTTI